MAGDGTRGRGATLAADFELLHHFENARGVVRGHPESEVLEKRESRSRPEAGLVTVRTTGRNQDGAVVCAFERTILVAKRGHSVEDRIGY